MPNFLRDYEVNSFLKIKIIMKEIKNINKERNCKFYQPAGFFELLKRKLFWKGTKISWSFIFKQLLKS